MTDHRTRLENALNRGWPALADPEDSYQAEVLLEAILTTLTRLEHTIASAALYIGDRTRSE